MLVLAIEGLGAEELGYKLGFLKFLSLSNVNYSPVAIYNFWKGDGNVRFSGQQRQLLRNWKSYNDEILHGGKLFGVLWENVEFETVQPL